MDPKVLTDLLRLPWALLVTLACGYMGYFVAHVGVREHHKAIDVTFSTLVFGFIAAFGYQIALRAGDGMLLSAIFAALVACVAGAFWSKYGRASLNRIIRGGKISLNDDDPSAWTALFRPSDCTATQLSVKLKDGTWLKCDDLSAYSSAINGACVFGLPGDLLMHVTHHKSPTDDDFEPVEFLKDPYWGTEITYIPKDQIARVDFRRKP